MEKLKFNVEMAKATGFFISGTSGHGKSDLGMWLCKKLIENGVQVVVIDPSQDWLRTGLRPIIITKDTEKVQFGKNENVILDTSRLTVRQSRKFVEDVCLYLFDRRVHNGERHPLVIIFEECHLFLPNHALQSHKHQNAMRIITVGRNYGIRFGAITQFASMVDKLILKIAQQLYLGYSHELNDKKYLRNFIGDRVNELEDLRRGEFLYDSGKKTVKVKSAKFEGNL